MPPTTSSVSQTVSSITLTVSSGNPPTIISQQFDTSTLNMGANSIQITNPGILSRYAEPGLQHSHSLFLGYGGELSHVSTAAAVSDFVATPLILSNFGPSFNYAYVSGGVGTFTLQPPSCNNSSLTNFLYTSGNTSIATVGLKTGIVTLVGAGTTTVTASLPKEGGYTNAYVEASVTINPIAPTFSNGGVFTISSKNFGDAPFTPAYSTSNSLGAFTYTSSATSIATVHPTTGVVTNVAVGTAIIRATQAGAGNYTSAYAEASFEVTASPLMLDSNGVTIKYTRSSIPSVPFFIQASPRGTGMEWFAVVNNTSNSMITNYANNVLSGPGRTYFTYLGNVVPFNNIVTTLLTDASSLFNGASAFNQLITSWDTANVTTTYQMFQGAAAFNQPLNSWNTAKFNVMSNMFESATSFNQPLNSWNTSNVTNMFQIFGNATKFNQPLNSWNTANVLYMHNMFYNAAAFIQPLNSWNTANVINMNNMFQGATLFNQYIGAWNVAKVSPNPPTNFSTGSALSAANTPVLFISLASYRFDGNGNDSTINNNHLTNVNTVTFNTTNYKRGSAAASFNGSNYFQITNDGRFSPDNFTVALWIKPQPNTSYQAIASCRASSPWRGWMLYIGPSSAGSNLEIWSSTNGSIFTGQTSLFSNFGELNAWVHLAFTLNKSTSALIVYINGTVHRTITLGYTNNTTTSLRIGAGTNEQSALVQLANGTLMDDFRFYNKVLTASEVYTLL